MLSRSQENEKNSDALDTGGAHGVTIREVPSMERFQMYPSGKSRLTASRSYGVIGQFVHQIRTYVNFGSKSSLHFGWQKLETESFRQGDAETMQ